MGKIKGKAKVGGKLPGTTPIVQLQFFVLFLLYPFFTNFPCLERNQRAAIGRKLIGTFELWNCHLYFPLRKPYFLLA